MSAKRKAPTPPQPVQTTPKGYEIPVPQRSAVLGALARAAEPRKPEPAETTPKA
jgi:hypothetical protein